MTLNELITFVRGVRPGIAFDNSTLVTWANEIEGRVQTDIMALDTSSITEYSTETLTSALLVPEPFSKLYRYFLYMMIDLSNGEYKRYANSYALFNEAYEEYSGWYATKYAPRTGLAEFRGYYLSAYGVAVKNGFAGTETEWLATLKGEDGNSGAAIVSTVFYGVDENGGYIYEQTFDNGTKQYFTAPKGDSGGGAVDSVNGKTGVVLLNASDVGALPDDTYIPSKTSDLINDSGFLTEHQSLAAYRTSEQQDIIDNGKQPLISDLQTIRNGASAGSTAYQKPSSGIPASDMTSAVRTSLSKADSALQQHQSLSAYRTAAAQDVIDAGKQSKLPNPIKDKYLHANSLTGELEWTSGGGGGSGGAVDSVNGKTGAVVLSASDVGALPDTTPIPTQVTESTVSGWGFTKNTGTYSKPSTGIPKTDLASTVQTSLSKADTAVQPETGKGLFSGNYNDLTNKPTIPTSLSQLSADSTHRTVTDNEKSTWDAKGTYSKPSGGIPASDLAPGVIPTGLPSFSSADNGKFLRIVNGAAVWESMEEMEGGIY